MKNNETLALCRVPENCQGTDEFQEIFELTKDDLRDLSELLEYALIPYKYSSNSKWINMHALADLLKEEICESE